jgi:hypothetical protein
VRTFFRLISRADLGISKWCGLCAKGFGRRLRKNLSRARPSWVVAPLAVAGSSFSGEPSLVNGICCARMVTRAVLAWNLLSAPRRRRSSNLKRAGSGECCLQMPSAVDGALAHTRRLVVNAAWLHAASSMPLSHPCRLWSRMNVHTAWSSTSLGHPCRYALVPTNTAPCSMYERVRPRESVFDQACSLHKEGVLVTRGDRACSMHVYDTRSRPGPLGRMAVCRVPR